MATKKQILELLQKTPNRLAMKLLHDMADIVVWMSGAISVEVDWPQWQKSQKKLKQVLSFLEKYENGK
jgi:hypothetical protein